MTKQEILKLAAKVYLADDEWDESNAYKILEAVLDDREQLRESLQRAIGGINRADDVSRIEAPLTKLDVYQARNSLREALAKSNELMEKLK